MKRIIFMLVFVLTVFCANAQNRHSSRSAVSADSHRKVRVADNNIKPRKQQSVLVASPEQVMLMVEQINKLPFAKDKVDFAVFCVKLLPVPAEGIVRLAAAMPFESDKLEFLKEAFRYCPDSYNYFIVEEAFSFKSSADELRRHIEKEYHFKYAY